MDSTIVLQWINSSPHTLKFVANRLAEIQNKTSFTDWRHIPTNDNPADLISRGQSPEDFLQPNMWQTGPRWLQQPEECWPMWSPTPLANLPGRKAATCLATTPVDNSLLDRFSSWPRKAIHAPEESKYAGQWETPTTQSVYRQGMNIARRGPTESSIDGFHTEAPDHPTQISDNVPDHRKRAQVRQRYWPIDGRSQVWHTIKNCVCCVRAHPPQVDYIMGNLPEARVTESRPFTNVGVDYCGPFYIKEKRDRNRRQVKVYVAIFICLAVKAVHIELVGDLTSETFIAALRRFIARRRFCSTLHSDNGSNFIGANNDLRELYELLKSDDHIEKVTTFLANKQIEWHFIPPHSPHFGGLCEAAVKSFKHHFRRIVGNELLTFEQFNTLVIEIEAVLNSRPLTPISTDPKDLLVLTPGHFLIGESLMSVRERDFRDTPSNRLSRWQHIQKLKQHFWKRWHKEYLNQFNNRSKWTKGGHNIQEGTIALLREDNVPSMHWPLGRVVKVHPGTDDIIRTVTVQTS
ncbi:uncharacterized protein LOC117240067 [Bombus vosnesenskii]|uniref:Uncharacterized protein LOC117240067 n=1 Tax=Bombus vosnesenskii TaxID=207650 RepID=A0A6J3L997_9HYME|nr:uncharacterized protein LOC117240067 [Bombus vosnesenskii]